LARKKIPTITVANDLILKKLVERGLGMAIIPKELIEAEIRSNKLIPLFAEQTVPVKIEIDLAFKKRHVLSMIEKEFYEFVTKKAYGV
jgi:DNA-binding transcriptional LysR family regulator